MPELPEVETVKNVITPIVVGNTITKIDVLRASIIVGDIDEFINSLTNEKFLSVSRIGKFLIFHLTNNKVIISHLRMEGKYFEVLENEENTKYARVVFHLNNGHKICYDDSRTFGKLKLSNELDYRNEKELTKLGPEPFNADYLDLYKKASKMSLPIKSALLDQTLMTGLGNIYVDETLFASKVHPLTPAKEISKQEWKEIVENAARILTNAIKAGGSTIRSYHPGKGIDGNFQTNLLAYGKADEPCPSCGHIFRFIKVGGRGTTYCPNCQIKKSDRVTVALVGKVASGKSEVLRIFKENNIPTISSDEIVKELYKTEPVIEKINKAFKLDFKGEINKDELREYLIKNPKDLKRLERIVHPLVKEEIIKFNKANKGIIVSEVPLLFNAKMENMFDVVIGIDVSKNIQEERLAKREGNKTNQMRLISANNSFDENKNKVDYIISNESNLANLTKQVNQIINKLKDRLS